MAGKRHVTIDWTVPQYCLDCRRQMRKASAKPDGVTVKYATKGYCSTCAGRLQKDGTLVPKKQSIDWTVPQYCRTCQRQMDKRHTGGSGRPSHAHNGNCNDCRGKELRAAKGAKPMLPVVFDEHGQVCAYCKRHRPYTEFSKAKGSVTGYSSYCRKCNRLRLHKVPAVLYYEAVEQGRYVCQICDKTEEENGQALSIDHDHSCCPGSTSCGTCFRGFLCNRCNWGIGHFEDKLELLDKAKAYLVGWETKKATAS